MFEQSKAAKRRFDDGNFHNRYFIGKGIDIGCGDDNLGRLRHVFRGIQDVRPWDLPDGDAQYLESVSDNEYDFVVSSHCLEHMVDVRIALKNWIRVCKPNGYLVITVPDEEMYEQGIWPSQYNPDHKWSFTLNDNRGLPAPYRAIMSNTINVLELCLSFNTQVVVEKIEMIRDFYYEGYPAQDQTLHPCIESCIEIILRKL
jgi:ubiquinone/menaquinone biosynthesis C-methylase UbiE